MGSSVVFEAETEKPDAKVKWQCNGKDIANGDKYTITADGSKHALSIRAVAQEDANIYAVISGRSKVKFELKVVSKPGGKLLCCSYVFKVAAGSRRIYPRTP